MPSVLRALTLNWKLKLLAFALAVLLWVVVSAEEVTSRWIDVPLRVRVTDPEFHLVPSSAPRLVAVRFSGPRRELTDLWFRRPPLLLNVLEVEDVEQSFPLEARMLQVPSQLAVNIIDLQPATVTLRFVRVESRTVPVRARVGRGPGEGWTLVDSLTVEPARIRISGPDVVLAGVEFVATEPITLAPADSAFSLLVPLDTGEIAGVRLSTRRVRVSGRVDRLAEREYAGVTVFAGPGVDVIPATVDVRLVGAQRVLDRTTAGDFLVEIAVDSVPTPVPAEGVSVPLRVERLHPGLRAEVDPSTVRLMPRVVPETGARPAAPADTLNRPD